MQKPQFDYLFDGFRVMFVLKLSFMLFITDFSGYIGFCWRCFSGFSFDKLAGILNAV